MRILWRNFELPLRVVHNTSTATPEYCEFIAEPFERGFGNTIGNSLRRILLSAIEGCAVTSIKIDGVKHEFSTIPGVLEDVAAIVLNVKQIRMSMKEGNSATLFIDQKEKGLVTAGDIRGNGNVVVHNKDLVLATLAGSTEFKMELQVQKGRGYRKAEENAREPQEIGVIPIASIFSPVRHVQYKVENTRVGKITNYDRLILAVTTDGTISPEMAMVESAKILRKHLNPFLQYFELGKEVAGEPNKVEEIPEQEPVCKGNLMEILEKPIAELNLTVRSSNCLSSEGIRTIKDLVVRSDAELLKMRNFGKTSLQEIKLKLEKQNLYLGMSLEE